MLRGSGHVSVIFNAFISAYIYLFAVATQDRNDGVGLNGGERENIRSSEKEEIRKRKNNVVMYRVPELDSDDVLERTCGDEAYVHEYCVRRY